jgi:hypothetical protein
MAMDLILNELERRVILLEWTLVNMKARPIRDEAKIAILEKRHVLLQNQIMKKQDDLQKKEAG